MQEKSKITAYVLWLLIGAFGAHRFYLGRVISGGIMAALLVVSLVVSGVNGYLMAQELLEENGNNIEALTNPFSTFMILSFITGAMFLIWICWYLLDLVLIHFMMKKDKQRQAAISSQQAEDVFG